MVDVVLLVVVATGLALTLIQWRSARRLLSSGSPPPASDPPPVSILKPVKGVDPALEDNLETFFRLDYPSYEIIFATDDVADPAVPLLRTVMARHPETPCTLVVDPRRPWLNPKVDNLANAASQARHDVLLISDSNVAVEPDYLRDLAAHLVLPGVGLVTSPIRGVASGGSLGAALETLQLNAFVLGSVASVHLVAELPCVVGKSMLFRRDDLRCIGGWDFLGQFLAEDQACGEEMARHGLKVRVSSRAVDNVIGDIDVRAFAGRHLRWARLRSRIAPGGYLVEALANPVFTALVGAAVLRDVTACLAAAGTLLVASALARSTERCLGVPRPAWHYPPLELLRSVLTGVLWPVAWMSSTVTWRGNRLRIGARTRLLPPSPAIRVTAHDEGARGLATH